MLLKTVLNAVLLSWLVFELINARRQGKSKGTAADRHSFAVMWITIGAAFLLANLATAWARTQHAAFWPAAVGGAGLGLAIAGIGFRVYAIRVLGRWFTPQVTLQPGQELVTTGPYRWLRHPTYTGLWLALAGVGIATRSALAAMILAVVPGVGLGYRIQVEERALEAFFGDAYRQYARRTWRLIPFIY